MAIVKKPITDSITEHPATQIVMPVIRGKLGGHYRRSDSVPVLYDLKKILLVDILQGIQPEVIEDQYINLRGNSSHVHQFFVNYTQKSGSSAESVGKKRLMSREIYSEDNNDSHPG